jgi:thymidylate synthase
MHSSLIHLYLYQLLLLSADLSPGDFVHVIGDAHVYRTHVRALEEQIQKIPKPFPVSNSCDTYSIKSMKPARKKDYLLYFG